ncbi:MAG TPA: TetR/AcrR family transcriptional regulator [Firmicutes bacterium]|nr:TetR/AcrR family transcriptional regulator [Candidatus Fermentithermobacillaceae bacterium]
MPFAKDSTEETKKRIIEVVRRHFSEKGFDAARVDEIAKDAGVNKALIYYYFESKEAILDHLIQELFDDVSALALEFVEEHVVSMISQGRLDIESDRWRFASEDDAMDFYRACLRYVEKIVDFSLSNRGVVRIAIFESLKHGKHKNTLFQLLDRLYNKNESPLYRTIWSADHDFDFTPEAVVFRFFFGFFPVFNLAAHFDAYVQATGLSESEVRDSFIRGYQKVVSVYFRGKEIVL